MAGKSGSGGEAVRIVETGLAVVSLAVVLIETGFESIGTFFFLKHRYREINDSVVGILGQLSLKPLESFIGCVKRAGGWIQISVSAVAGQSVGKLPLIRLLQLCLTQSTVPVDFKVSCLLENILPDHLK
ncbi:hypothetical protein EBS57_10030, partial [bacterium]|nr:hypothetical protein [bacterium]